MKFLVALLLIFLGFLGSTASAAVKVAPEDQVVLDKFLKHTHDGLATLTKEHFEQVKVPEKICWLDCPVIHSGIVAYQLTGDVAWLRETSVAIENLRAAAKKGPDGFTGWYGVAEDSLKDPANPDAIISEIQTDFRVVGTVSEFLQLVDRQPEMKKDFISQRAAWVDLMRNDLVKKWDPSFRDLGPLGGVYLWNKAYKPTKREITLSHEKMSNMINGLVQLYTITDDDELMRNAVKLGTYLKHCLELKDGAYAWRFWNPTGTWDINPDDLIHKMTWKEPMGAWYDSTVSSAMQLYRHGFVFDGTDRDRFLKTQMTVCWNGDAANPVYHMTDGSPAQKGQAFVAPALSPFDAKFYQFLYTGPMQAERVQTADSPWQGGVLVADWLYGKYILHSPTEKAKPIDLRLYDKFTSDKANEAWLKSIAFEVKPDSPLPPTPVVDAAK